MRILLVDDSPTVRRIQRRCLCSLDTAEFVEAADGIEALAAIAAGPPFDVILIDWNMPNMDGLTLVARIRETDKRVPLIMCTAINDRNRVLEAIAAGVNNYVVKPFTPASLLEKVCQTLDKTRAAAGA